MITKNKRSQSEAVGFIVIILLVIIVGVIFLGISLRDKKEVVTKDAELATFLSASQGYTTECYKDSVPYYRNLGELVRDCFRQTSIVCPENRNTCDIVNKTYSEMLSKFMPSGVLNYYKMSIYYQSNNNETNSAKTKVVEDIVFGDSNKCSNKRIGRSDIPGDITVELEICVTV